MGDSSTGLPRLIDTRSASAPPANARFFEKLIMSFMRTSGSSLRQKSCMTGETPAKNPMMAKALNFGFTPSRRLAPPKISGSADNVTADSGVGTAFDSA